MNLAPYTILGILVLHGFLLPLPLASEKRSPLHCAAFVGDTEIVELLISEVITVVKCTALTWPVRRVFLICLHREEPG